MKEQQGVPLLTGDVIRFDQMRQQGGSPTSNRYRAPAGSIHRAGHSINHHPEDAPYVTDDFTPQVARSQRHQAARSASGILTFYNGQASAQTIPLGTVITGQGGVKVASDQTVIIPSGTPPTYGQASVTAHALVPGSAGNMTSGDINTAIALAVFVKNGAFAGGQNQRDYRVVAQYDQDQLSLQLHNTLEQDIPQAFPLAVGEQVFPTDCTFEVSPNHQVGTEASTLTVTAIETCTGIAYNPEQLHQQAIRLFTRQTAPGVQYQLVGELQVQIVSVTLLIVSCRGLWAYGLSQDYEQFLAEQIAGHTAMQAQKYLLQTGLFTRATVPGQLPSDPAHIRFQALMGI